MSLFRLELCAASLLTRLVAHFHQALGAGDALIHLWSDSTVTLGWIRGHSSCWKVYALPGVHWHYLPGTENPADCASRGISPSELVSHSLWWRDPVWLSGDPTSWPSSQEEESTGNMLEERVMQKCCRVGGGIKHALLAYDERHPTILPSSSHFTQLIVEACHRRTMHGGVQLTLKSVRQCY
ncbi:hypothetical protein ACFW04_014736 [Cataglyphis niger]